MTTAIAVRPAVEGDAPELARLLTALGFPTEPRVVSGRWASWVGSGNSAVVADCGDGRLAGVATLHRMSVLHRPAPVGRITALVVDAAWRGRGVGRALVEVAEDQLALAGCGLLEVTSNQRLAGAHAFYARLGYERTSVRFAKSLAPWG